MKEHERKRIRDILAGCWVFKVTEGIGVPVFDVEKAVLELGEAFTDFHKERINEQISIKSKG